jgi:hypothetical protein
MERASTIHLYTLTHNMSYQQIRGYTSSDDLRWTCDAYLVTVNCVLLYTMTKASNGYKFDDLWCILLKWFYRKIHGLHCFFKIELPGWDMHIARTSCSLTDDHHTEQPIWRDRSGFLLPWCATNYGLLAHRSVGWFPQYRCLESSLSTRWRAQSD